MKHFIITSLLGLIATNSYAFIFKKKSVKNHDFIRKVTNPHFLTSSKEELENNVSSAKTNEQNELYPNKIALNRNNNFAPVLVVDQAYGKKISSLEKKKLMLKLGWQTFLNRSDVTEYLRPKTEDIESCKKNLINIVTKGNTEQSISLEPICNNPLKVALNSTPLTYELKVLLQQGPKVDRVFKSYSELSQSSSKSLEHANWTWLIYERPPNRFYNFEDKDYPYLGLVNLLDDSQKKNFLDAADSSLIESVIVPKRTNQNLTQEELDLRINDNVLFCKNLKAKYKLMSLLGISFEDFNLTKEKFVKSYTRFTVLLNQTLRIENNLNQVGYYLQKRPSAQGWYYGQVHLTPKEEYEQLEKNFEYIKEINSHCKSALRYGINFMHDLVTTWDNRLPGFENYSRNMLIGIESINGWFLINHQDSVELLHSVMQDQLNEKPVKIKPKKKLGRR